MSISYFQEILNILVFVSENTERQSRKGKLFDESKVVPSKKTRVTDQISSTKVTSFLYDKSGMISQPESSVELLRITGDIPDRGYNPILPFVSQLFQQSKVHNEVDNGNGIIDKF